MPSKKIYNPDVLFKVQGLIIISSEMSWTMNKKRDPKHNHNDDRNTFYWIIRDIFLITKAHIRIAYSQK